MAEKPLFHLLIVGISWPPETFLQRMIRELAKSGVRITIATSQKPSTTPDTSIEWLKMPSWEGHPIRFVLQIFSIGLSHFFRSPSDVWNILSHSRTRASNVSLFRTYGTAQGISRLWPQHFPQLLMNFARLLPFAGHQWDVIYFPWNSSAVHYLPLFDRGAPVVISCRGAQVNIAPHNPQRVALREGLAKTFQRAAAVHCVSEAIKREAMQYGLDPDKAWVIRPAVDPEFFRPGEGVPRVDTTFRIVSTGALIWRKGYEYALLAVRQLVDRGVPVHYDIIGDGPERQRVLYTIHDLELQHHVRLVGSCPPERVRDLLQPADVFLLSSLSEGISNAALEAMACGVPVVTTDCGGMREAVTDGVEGFLVPVREAGQMAQRLHLLWKDRALRERMGAAARQRVLREFSLEQQAQQFLAMYQSVMKASR